MRVTLPVKRIGKFALPVIGLGTWTMGGSYTADTTDDEKNIAAIRFALRSGIYHLDTAEIYGQGHAEELVGRAIRSFDRQQLFITSKVSWHHLRYDQVIRAAQSSLGRLGIRQFDLYLIHAPNPAVPLKETMRAMDYLLENEKTRFIGVSNFTILLLEEAISLTKYKIVANQIHYSLSARAYEENGTLNFCLRNNILVIAYRPLGKGELLQQDNSLLLDMAEKYKKTPAQIALNWVIGKPNVVTIFKSANPDHILDNLEAVSFSLAPEDEKKLDLYFPRQETMLVGTHPPKP